MTNNQLCNLLGAVGCLVSFISMSLMLFGLGSAAWAAAAGLLLTVVSLASYD